MEPLFSHISRFELSNGIRVMAIPVAGRRSAVFGVWILSGSAAEPPKLMGISHFLEHLVFKGTAKFSAHQIVSKIEACGGKIDAYTSREEICLQATTPGENIDIAQAVLSQLACFPALRESDMIPERQVILSEMDEVRDDPGSLAQEIFPTLVFGDVPLGRPIIGSVKSVKAIGIDDIRSFHSKHFFGENIIIGAAGAVEPEKFAKTIERLYKVDSMPRKSDKTVISPQHDGELILIPYKCQQTYFIMGIRTFPYRDERRYILALLDTILGRGSASRLFQKIREELGIAYVVQSFAEYYRASGLWGIYAATAPESFAKMLKYTFAEIRRIIAEKPGNDELEYAKSFLRGRLLLSSENPWSLLARAVESEVHLGKFISFEETIERIMSITAEQIQELAQQLFTPEKIFAMAMGKLKSKIPSDIDLHIRKLEIEDVMPDILWRD